MAHHRGGGGYNGDYSYYNAQGMSHHTTSTFNVNAPVFVPQRHPQQVMDQYQFMSTHQNQYLHSQAQQPFGSAMGMVHYGGAGYVQQQQQDYLADYRDLNAHNPATHHQQDMTYYASNDDFQVYPGGQAQFHHDPSQVFRPSKELSEQIDQLSVSLRQKVFEIIVGLESLLQQNEGFDCWSIAIRDRISNEIDCQFKRIVVHVICEIGMYVSPTSSPGFGNPQYSMARLLGTLCDDIPDLLKEYVFEVFEVFVAAGKECGLSDEQILKFKCNRINFFAECFSHVLLKDCHIEAIGLLVVQLISAILKSPSTLEDPTVKSLVMAMKIAGPELDSLKNAEVTSTMNDILTTLSGIAKGSPKISPTVKSTIEQLILTRQRGWGGQDYQRDDGSHFELNDEERLFLEQHMKDDTSNEAADSSLDDDVAAEYDTFLQEEELSGTMHMLDNLDVSESEEPGCPSQNKTEDVTSSETSVSESVDRNGTETNDNNMEK